MNRNHHLRVGLTAALLLVGCGGQGSVPQSLGNQAAAQGSHSKSWILPEAKSEALLYASNRFGGNVYIFSYATRKEVGEITGLDSPNRLCTDGNGNVWVTNGEEVDEYAHGATIQSAMLGVPGGSSGCTVDPATGNLAVTYASGSVFSNVAVYANAQGAPIKYVYNGIPFTIFSYCTYDDQSNLFLSAQIHDFPYYVIYELPKGSHKFVRLSYSGIPPHFPDNEDVTLQWDGRRLAYGGQLEQHTKPVKVYQIKVSGTKAKLSGGTEFSLGCKPHVCVASQFWIFNNSLIQSMGPHIGIWQYPAGGKPERQFKSLPGVNGFAGVTVSVPPSQ